MGLNTNIILNPIFVSKTDVKNDDLRGLIHPKSMPGNQTFFSPVPYTQLFGRKFEANLSILDLLFCEGPNADNILHSSIIH